MPKIQLLNQPYGESFGSYLLELIRSGEYNCINIVVAFAKSSGIAVISDAVSDFRNNGGRVDIYVGFDLDGTSYEALERLFEISDNLYLLHTNSQQTFHPKAYNLKSESKAVLAVGSNNLTAGGLLSNAESSLITFLDFSVEDDKALQETFDRYLATLRSEGSPCFKVNDMADIEKLLEDGIIFKEATIAKKHKPMKAGKTDRMKSIFCGCFGSIPKRVAERSSSNHRTSRKEVEHEQPSISTLSDVLWIETRAGTGGSNNQLDLSMTGVIAPGDHGNEEGTKNKRTEGSVAFFGIDPNSSNTTYKIAIEFEGIRYQSNEIKIYKGAGSNLKRPNGSWRMYLNGKNGNMELSTALRTSGLAHKIAVFSRKEDDYLLRLYDESHLSAFIETSDIVAHASTNLNNRYYGLIGVRSVEAR